MSSPRLGTRIRFPLHWRVSFDGGMRYTFIQPAPFVSEWNRLGPTDDDLRHLEHEIMARPNAGAVMKGTGGMRKMRFAPPSWHTGKSGAARICYVVFEDLAKVFLLVVFPKNEKVNLTGAERNYFRKLIAALYERAQQDG